MSETLKKGLAIIVLAGILILPACTQPDKSKNGPPSQSGVTTTSPQPGSGDPLASSDPNSPQGNGQNTSGGSVTQSGNGKDSVKVITSQKELEEYFNSISDKEIQDLYKAIEDIDISGNIDINTDPGFDQVTVP